MIDISNRTTGIGMVFTTPYAVHQVANLRPKPGL